MEHFGQVERDKIALAFGPNVAMVRVAWTPRVRVFIEAEKRQLTNNLTFNLRCQGNVRFR